MNTNYSEALEEQLSLLRVLEQPDDQWALLSRLGDIVQSMARDGKRVLTDDSASRATLRLRDMTLDLLSYADTYYVAPDISTFLEVASRGYPVRAPEETALPSRMGFVHFARPVFVPDDRYWFRKDGRRGFGIARMGWGSIESDDLMVWIWAYLDGFMDKVPECIGVAGYGETADPTFLRPGVLSSAVQVLGSLTTFMEQRVLVTSRRAAERHVRKRLERAKWRQGDPLVRVVELRQREYAGSASVDVIDREWSCQWMVRGHWRQQPYPKAGDVRPKWITPYVKGPDDKPLKPPRATVFAVVR